LHPQETLAMTILDKVIAAVTPPESQEERQAARAKARSASAGAPWLARVLEHHQQVEAAFAAVKDAGDASGRRQAQRWLATLLTGHSLAEEAVLYPAMALTDQKAHATAAYTEQSGAKINLAALETIDPMSQDYLDKLEHVRGAVAHHVYEEEDKWFPALAAEGDNVLQARLSARYMEEFTRYMGADADGH
jgi:hemerythrin HHE cation binding domain-containing protein